MTLTEKFIQQRMAFETAYKFGNWGILKPFFTDDMVYEVMNMPFHCKLQPLDARYVIPD